MNRFGSSSQQKLSTCSIDLQKVMNLAISRSPVDFGIAFGGRTPVEQFILYKKGREEQPAGSGNWVVVDKSQVVTNCDGYKNPSKHNFVPSQAADIYIYVPGDSSLTYDNEHLSFVAGIIISCAAELLAKGEITHRITWGGNWDGDGIILKDQNMYDRPHFQIDAL